jgi:murein DD-endopeptidase MepM/ murein hydrolase activator NlpD
MMARALCFSIFLSITVASSLLHADQPKLHFTGAFEQGGLVIGETAPDTIVTMNGRKLLVSPNGKFIFGFGRDYKKTILLSARFANGESVERRFKIKQRKYKIQRIDGLKKAMVNPNQDALKRIKREGKLVAQARANNTEKPWFENGFIWPTIGPISGVYGSQRILNGQPRRPHFGVDVAMPTGTPVKATTDGRVTLAEKDLYFTGGSIIIDHGHGLSSTYIHLSEVAVEVDQVVKQGETIGAIGATGRVTGPHLDWRFNWFKERLDPQLLAPPMPKTK